MTDRRSVQSCSPSKNPDAPAHRPIQVRALRRPERSPRHPARASGSRRTPYRASAGGGVPAPHRDPPPAHRQPDRNKPRQEFLLSRMSHTGGGAVADRPSEFEQRTKDPTDLEGHLRADLPETCDHQPFGNRLEVLALRIPLSESRPGECVGPPVAERTKNRYHRSSTVTAMWSRSGHDGGSHARPGCVQGLPGVLADGLSCHFSSKKATRQ